VAEEAEVLRRVVAWAQTEPSVRAMILTSSRARADETVDELSDYDVILAVTDAETFVRDEPWLSAYERPVARWGDEHEVLGLRTRFRGVVHADGVKIDWTIWPDALLVRVTESDALPEALDVGYRVLLDKDGRTAAWKPPTFRAHIPARPTAEEYRALVEEFWWDSTYVAKALWRGQLTMAKFVLDYEMKLVALGRMLEWWLEIRHEWSLWPGVLGTGLERTLPAELWSEFASTYVGSDPGENWDALFRTTALFRRVATQVGAALGYAYPHEVDAIEAQLKAVRDRPPRVY
jgi:aminoglycoside 6-adenylyltransferase